MSKYQFSKKSNKKLNQCDHHLVIFFNEVIKHRDCTILEGRRNRWRQDWLFYTKKSLVRYPNSKHNALPLSKAVDVAPYFAERDKRHRLSMIKNEVVEFGHYCLGIRDAMNLTDRIRWGGDWNRNYLSEDEKFLDAFHWEVI